MIGVFILLTVMWILLGSALIYLGYRFDNFQNKAIKRGHAYWHVNEDGSTEFRWKENE